MKKLDRCLPKNNTEGEILRSVNTAEGQKRKKNDDLQPTREYIFCKIFQSHLTDPKKKIYFRIDNARESYKSEYLTSRTTR